MKQVLTISILLLSLSAGMQDSMVLLLFKLNQSTIIQNFCINRDKPELGCNGKCHLKNQLDQQHEKDQTDWSVGWKNRVTQLNLTLFASFLTNFISSEIRNDLEPVMPSAPGVRQFMNLDEAFRTGFEVSWGQQLLVGLQHRFQVAYTYADDLDNKEPLPEIAPLDLRYRLMGSYLDNKLLPEISVRHVIKQHRIVDSYGETKTPAFTVLDLLVRYQPSLTTSFSVGAYNVLDEAYYEHLSRSVRDASQSPLYAPGRSFILTMAIQLN